MISSTFDQDAIEGRAECERGEAADRASPSAAPASAPLGAGPASKDDRAIKACRMLLSNARATGKTASLFAASARNDFASLYDIAHSGEGLWEQALEIYVEARALADEHSTKIGAKPDWEEQNERLVRARAKRAAKTAAGFLSPLDFALADEFIGRNPAGCIFRAKRTGSLYLWVADAREWLVDDDIQPAVYGFLKAAAEANAADRPRLLKYGKLSSVYAAIGASDTLPIKDVEFDARKDLLGLPGAMVCDLREGMQGIRPREPDDFVTMETATFPAKGATPGWDGFLERTFNNGTKHDTAELVAYMRRLTGYACTGFVGRRKAYVLEGDGHNGKTTYCEIVRGVLGDISNGGYACLSTEKIISANYAGHDTIFAEPEKARFVEIPEIGPNLLLGAMFKQLTGGGDRISGRGMRENARKIVWHGKPFICANAAVKCDGSAKAYRDRLETIPFRNEVDKPVLDFASKLVAAEGPGILAEAIEQAALEINGGAWPHCATIVQATKAYADRADRYAEFFREDYTTAPDPDWTEEQKKGQALLLAEARVATKQGKNIPTGCKGTRLAIVFDNWKTRAEEAGEPWIGSIRDLAAALRAKGVPVGLHPRLRTMFCAGLRKKRPSDEKKEAETDAETDAERAQIKTQSANDFEEEQRALRRELDIEDLSAGPPLGKDEDED
jgi:phage/plasmid-associated DNA primase